MIVKVERHLESQDWWMIDNIAKVSCSKKIKDGNGLGDITIMDHEKKCSCNEGGGCGDCVCYYRLICRTKDYNEFSIIFDTVAYLCNDEGKTIEKIVANYSE